MYWIFKWKLSTTSTHCCIIFQQYTQYNDTTTCVNWPSVPNFYMKIINNKHTLLYNRSIIYSIQQYNNTTACVNWSMEKMCKVYWIFSWKLSITSIRVHCCIIAQCTQYNDTTTCVNWLMEKNVYKFMGFLNENYQQQAYAVV